MKRNSIYLLVAFLALAVAVNAQTTDTITLKPGIFGQERQIRVVLPAGYSKYPNTDKKYIVACLFDAQSDSFFNLYKATVNYLAEQGYLQPLILVGISSGNRQYEFTPAAQSPEGQKAFRKSGGADTLAMHLQNEVLPAIQSKYRCKTYTVGIGHSLGATFVTYCMLKHPGLFNAAIAISPNFEYDQEQVVHEFAGLKNTGILNHKFLYLAYGSGDAYEDRFKPATEKFGSLLRSKDITGLRWQCKRMDNDSHGTTAMEGIFKGLVALNRQLTLPDAQSEAFYKNAGRPFIEQVKTYYLAASSWSGLQLPAADDLNNMGYNCYYAGKVNDAIQLFHWGISLYPDNINLYDSMGEMQKNAGNKTEALKYYSTALNMTRQLKERLDAKTYNKQVAYFEKQVKALEN